MHQTLTAPALGLDMRSLIRLATLGALLATDRQLAIAISAMEDNSMGQPVE